MLLKSASKIAARPTLRSSSVVRASAQVDVLNMATQLVPADRIRKPIDFSKLKGVFFDIDGTLCASDPLHFKAFQNILVEVGFDGGRPIDEAFFHSKISGRSNPIIAQDLFPEWEESERVKFYEEKELRFRQMADSMLVRLPGLTDFTAWIDRRQLRKGAVTNAPRLNTEMMLSALQLDTYFETVVIGDECTRPKPYPDPYLKGLEMLGLEAEYTVVLEDSPAGTQAAVAAGIPVIGLMTSHKAETLFEAGASMCLKDFTEVMLLVNSLAKL